MQEAFLDICGLPTKIVTWGKWVEDSFTEDESKDIVIMFMGNPGISKFYIDFLQTIHNQLGYTVWLIGQAGHELPKNPPRPIPPLDDNEKLYGLEGQILYKQAFIEKYVPKDAKIHFIGHSVGAYMIIQLLKVPSIQSKVVGNYLLFPTIERMGETKCGKVSNAIGPYVAWFLLLLVWFFSMLPIAAKAVIINICLKVGSIPKTDLKTQAIIDLLDVDVAKKALALGFNEFECITKRDDEVLTENKDKIKLYYSPTDLWAPPSYCEKLKSDIPEIHAEVCQRNFEHCFVLKNSKEMADIVVNWIQN